MSKNEKLKVGISIGDIAGIGPEVILKTFTDDRLYKLFTPVLFANSKVLSFYRKVLNIEKIQYSAVKDMDNLSHNSLNIINCWEEEVQITPGQPNEKTGELALKSLESATEALKSGAIDILITAPINKSVIHSEKFPFSGHTPYLQNKLGGNEVLMFMVSDNIKVGLVTEHIAVKDIHTHITQEAILKKLQLINQSLIVDFGIDKPRIAVLGLNPHAGDNGLIGSEEIEIIAPAIKTASKNGILAFGPYPADGFFAHGEYEVFDAILAMYHDQGLIPFKSLAIGQGTNYTAGMKVVRVSPDHGTAESIAGKNQADPSSFREAIFCAIDIYKNREQYAERNANPVEKRANLKDEDR
jgi:4-hydroxythreonine-4-phosphate dehydrogenase